MNVLKYGKLEENPAKLTETVTVKVGGQKPSSRKLTEGLEPSEYLLPRIEAIHAGRTRNYNHYLADKLRGDASIGSGVYSWLQPYAKPVIYNHDTDTEATGRILSAAYADYTQAGRPGIIVIPKITEPKAVQALRDERLLTVSIGASSDAAICSICGTDIVNEGYCGHMKGEEYNGQVAEWIAGNIWFDELSWVNVPADSDAMVVDTQSSIFLDVPQEQSTKEALIKESAPEDHHSHFGVPKHTKLIVVESKGIKTPTAEIKKQEENHEMDEELNKVIESEKPEDEVTEPTTGDVKVAEPEDEKPIDSTEPSKGDTPEADKVLPEDEKEDENSEDKNAVAEPVNEEPKTDEALLAKNEQLTTTAIGLQKQVEALTKELKALYVERIVEKSMISEDKKELFVEKLTSRSIDSLKDRLEDLEEGFVSVKEQEEVKERKVTKVNSPVQVAEETKSKKLTEKEKVNFLSSLIKQ